MTTSNPIPSQFFDKFALSLLNFTFHFHFSIQLVLRVQKIQIVSIFCLQVSSLQSFAGYLRLVLAFAWRGPLRGERGGVWFLFFKGLLVVLAKFSFWRGAGHWSIILWSLDTFLIFPNLLKSLKSFSNLWCNSYKPCLQVIITHCFTCGERKV